MALMRAAQGLREVEKGLTQGEAAGVALVRRACEVPCRQIVQNAGDDGAVVVQRVRAGNGKSEPGFGYNAATRQFEDLLEAGVVNPTMVVRLALQNAASIATLLLTAEVCIVDAPTDPVDFPTKGSSADALSLEPYLSRRRPRSVG